jgi:hypothetical protein
VANLKELVTYLRTDILDDLGGTGVDWTQDNSSSLLRWTNEELTRFINEAQKEVAKRTYVLRDSTSYLTKFKLKDGRQNYPLDEKILQINVLYVDGITYPLDKISYKDILGVADWRSDKGRPEYYFTDWSNGYVTFRYIPDSNYDGKQVSMQVFRLPIKDLTWSNNTEEPEVPEEMQYVMLYWAAHLAYQKDEPNSLSEERSGYYASKFTAEFGPKESYYSSERKKRKSRPVAISAGAGFSYNSRRRR